MEQIGDSLRQGQEQRSYTSRHFKQFGMGLISASLLILDWWLLKESLFGSQPTSFWIWPVIATTFWIAAVSFFALVNPDKLTFFIFNAVGFIAYLALMPRDIYVFVGGLIFFLLSLLFQRRVQDEKKNQLNFSIRRTLGNSQVIITYALLILVGFMIYSNVHGDFNKDRDQFYRKLGETAVKGIPYLSQDRSQYNLSQSMQEFFRKQAEQQFPQFNQVSAEQQRILLRQIQQNFQQQFGVDADENATLKVALTEVVTQRLRESLGRFERFFPLLFTILIIALLRTFAFVFNWIVLFVSWLLFKALLIVRFFRIEKETIEVEKLGI
ncbi:MAG: hypothetical protein KW793_03060 [Candidatus Doudnabacteria bacterium]|nr:hypothetical protein [Candidatus Doudnabacteria bacterium]